MINMEKTVFRAFTGYLYQITVFQNFRMNIQIVSPFFFIVNLEETFLLCEFLIRNKKTLKCDCKTFADEKQILYILRFIDNVFNELGIIY